MFRTDLLSIIRSLVLQHNLYDIYHCCVHSTTNDNTTNHMPFACWITKATNTHSEYVMRIAFPRQKMVARTRLNVTLYVQCLNTFSKKGMKMYTNRKVNKMEENKGR